MSVYVSLLSYLCLAAHTFHIYHANLQTGAGDEGERKAMELPDGVTWTQDEDSVEVSVAVPDDITRDDLRVTTQAEMLALQLCSSRGNWRPILTGHLRHEVERESCCWAIEKSRKGKSVVIQLEKREARPWDALLRASVAGSILEELGRDQVIVDAGASTSESVTCGRCGALVKSSRMEAHSTMWCDALASDDAAVPFVAATPNEEDARTPASHLYWSREPTKAEGAVPPQKLDPGTGAEGEASTATSGLEALRLSSSSEDVARAEVPMFSFVYELSEARVHAASIEAAAAAAVVAEGEAQWLVANWFGSQQRKHGVSFDLQGRSSVRVEGTSTSPEQSAAQYEAHWSKQIAAAVKKVDVENLGPMNAAELWAAIPEDDSAGRGRRDLAAMEKELGVKVCFCDNGNVLLVGAKAKLQKKCFVLRNLLSHYHWRLSGRDVAFETMTARW